MQRLITQLAHAQPHEIPSNVLPSHQIGPSFHADMTIRDRALRRCAMAFVSSVCMSRQRRRPKSRADRAPKRRLTHPARSTRLPDADLVSQFAEDVKNPLVPGRSKSDAGGEGAGFNPPWKDLDLSKYSNMSREETLDLLVRGAWIGIGVLVGYFFVVHFVIVRDLVPG